MRPGSSPEAGALNLVVPATEAILARPPRFSAGPLVVPKWPLLVPIPIAGRPPVDIPIPVQGYGPDRAHMRHVRLSLATAAGVRVVVCRLRVNGAAHEGGEVRVRMEEAGESAVRDGDRDNL